MFSQSYVVALESGAVYLATVRAPSMLDGENLARRHVQEAGRSPVWGQPSPYPVAERDKPEGLEVLKPATGPDGFATVSPARTLPAYIDSTSGLVACKVLSARYGEAGRPDDVAGLLLRVRVTGFNSAAYPRGTEKELPAYRVVPREFIGRASGRHIVRPFAWSERFPELRKLRGFPVAPAAPAEQEADAPGRVHVHRFRDSVALAITGPGGETAYLTAATAGKLAAVLSRAAGDVAARSFAGSSFEPQSVPVARFGA